MLDYGWDNASQMIITGENPDTDFGNPHSRQFYNPYTAVRQAPTGDPVGNGSIDIGVGIVPSVFSLYNNFQHQQQQQEDTFQSFLDYPSVSYAPPPVHSHMSLDHMMNPSGPTEFMMIPKTEPTSGLMDHASMIGLNLGGRTYFSATEEDFVSRLYHRSRGPDFGLVNTPRCQVEGCNADLSQVKHYHRRHKVCEYHSKAATVVAAGLIQRFCQQCSRFHQLSEFDNGKRSCRRRLADHNRRRRKSHQSGNQDNANDSQSENVPRSPSDSGAHSNSSVTVAVSSPPRMPLDSFRQRPYNGAAATSSASPCSMFY